MPSSLYVKIWFIFSPTPWTIFSQIAKVDCKLQNNGRISGVIWPTMDFQENSQSYIIFSLRLLILYTSFKNVLCSITSHLVVIIGEFCKFFEREWYQRFDTIRWYFKPWIWPRRKQHKRIPYPVFRFPYPTHSIKKKEPIGLCHQKEYLSHFRRN